jgi:hypothetical protein
MVKSKDLHEGTVIEVTSTEYMMFFGGYNPSASDYLAVGEQYEVKKIKRSTPLVVHLKHVDSNKGGGIYQNWRKAPSFRWGMDSQGLDFNLFDY